MKIRLVISLVALVLCIQPWSAYGKVAKVSCDKLSGLSIENLVCQDPELKRLDRLLGEVLSTGAKAVDTSGEQRTALIGAQQSWREARNSCWRDKDPRSCTLAQYEKRIVELQVGLGQVSPAQQAQYVCEGVGSALEELSLSVYRGDVPAVLAEFRGERLLLIGDSSSSEGAFRAAETTLIRERGDVMLRWQKGAQAREEAQAMRCVGRHWYSMGEPGKAPFADCYPP